MKKIILSQDFLLTHQPNNILFNNYFLEFGIYFLIQSSIFFSKLNVYYLIIPCLLGLWSVDLGSNPGFTLTVWSWIIRLTSVPLLPALYNRDAHPNFAEVAQSRLGHFEGPVPDTPAGMRRPAAAGNRVHLQGSGMSWKRSCPVSRPGLLPRDFFLLLWTFLYPHLPFGSFDNERFLAKLREHRPREEIPLPNHRLNKA